VPPWPPRNLSSLKNRTIEIRNATRSRFGSLFLESPCAQGESSHGDGAPFTDTLKYICPSQAPRARDGSAGDKLQASMDIAALSKTCPASSSDRSYIIPDACLLIYRKSHVSIALDQRRETRLHYTQVRSQDPSRYAACIGQRSEECFPSWRRSAYIHRSSPPLYTNSHQSWTSAARRISIHGCSAR
jgi:hypothetical protein